MPIIKELRAFYLPDSAKLGASELKALGAKKDFDFVTQQKGMFSFSGLNPEQVQRLKDEFGVYIVKSGRMCVASLNKDNVKYTAEAIKEVL